MAAGSEILESPEQVLTTLRKDGTRKWMKPRLSKGRFLSARRVVAYLLMALFFVLPFVRIHGKPAVFLDIMSRRFTIFGYTFLPTDTILLALFMLFVFVSIFLFTAILGRLWCGWMCPQTVYLEFLYRPLERLIEGTAGRGGEARGTGASWGRKAAYFAAALGVTILPAHTFLAYFVGVEALSQWVRKSPLEHPTAFLVMAGTTAAMMFDFYYFREQLCLIACPYGRLQSVLLDRLSVIVSYDKRRGEPRRKVGGRATSVALPVLEGRDERAAGDCVDCRMCVTTCPTGIDIRNGLQMECVSCTQCIDACDAVMDKIGRPRGLIRYSSQAGMDGEKPRRLRFRVVFYPVILAVVAAAWVALFTHKLPADVTVLRTKGSPFTELADGSVANSLRLKVQNRTDAAAAYRFELTGLPGAKLDLEENPVLVPAGEMRTVVCIVEAPAGLFTAGIKDAGLLVGDGREFSTSVPLRLLGPIGGGTAQEPDKEATHERAERK